jgi:hypothetical protein
MPRTQEDVRRESLARIIIKNAQKALGKDLGGSKLDLLCDNMGCGTTKELERVLIAIGHRCDICLKDKEPNEQHNHWKGVR